MTNISHFFLHYKYIDIDIDMDIYIDIDIDVDIYCMVSYQLAMKGYEKCFRQNIKMLHNSSNSILTILASLCEYDFDLEIGHKFS